MRFPMEWQHGDQIVLKTDPAVSLRDLDQMGAALIDWWLENLPRTRAERQGE